MRIEVLLPGIRKERGKLPARTTLEPLGLVSSLAAGRPIWGEPADVALLEPATVAEVGEPVATGRVQPTSSVSATANSTIASAMPLLRFRNTDTNRLSRFTSRARYSGSAAYRLVPSDQFARME
jgi:hypothetical protein